jgi:penicillin-binding protein 2
MFSEDDIVRGHKARADMVFNIIVIMFLVIIARLWYLQIYKGKEFYQFAMENRLRKEDVKAPRGMIFSRNNEILIQNAPRFDAVVIPQYLRNRKETFERLGKIVEMDTESIERIMQRNAHQARYIPVVIKKNLSQREVAIIETESSKLPGVNVDTFISREYTDKEIGAHLLGYISEITQAQLPRYRKRDKFNYKLGDFIGQAGIEEQYDLELRGEDGHEFMEVDARGRMKRHISSTDIFSGIKNKDAKAGNNIRLTIDRQIQLAASKALEGHVGSAVAVDIETGEILAMVSTPSFDPAVFSRGISREEWLSLSNDENRPLRDRTIQEHYSPGSVFKTFTLIAALEEKIYEPDQIVPCGPTFQLGRRTYHDWKKQGHGPTDAVKSLRESVDVYYYRIGTQLKIDKLAEYAKMFGLGTKTGISLANEIPGLIPTEEWKKKRNGEDWQLGETLSCVIGQSYVLTTPLQLAMSYAAIANGGKLYRPHLVKEIFTNNGEIVKRFESELVSEAKISDRTLNVVRRGLYEVVNERRGTAWWSRGRGIRMAGKTGTAQVRSFNKKELFSRCDQMPYHHRHHGLFAGYAPYDDPKIAFAVVIEHGCGGSKAAPVARDIATSYMKNYQPELYAKYSEEDRIQYNRMVEEERKRAAALQAAQQQHDEEEGNRVIETAE